MESRHRIIIIICITALVSVALVLIGISLSKIHQGNNEPVKRNDLNTCKLTSDKLVPILNNMCGRVHTLSVIYAVSGLNCNQSMNVAATDSKPKVKYTGAAGETLYTLLMVDPDAGRSSVEELKFYLHWAVTDIKGVDLKKGNINATELEEYFGPHPPSGTGPHRYQFLLFKSPDSAQVTLGEENKRSNFDLQQFIDDNSLCVLVDANQIIVEVKES